MKQIAFIAVLWAGAAQAGSLCGVTDEAAVRAAMTGGFTQAGALSIETETLSVTEPFADEPVIIDPAGRIMLPVVDQWTGQDVRTTLSGGIYDVDGVDDLLDTVDAAWIADAVGDTPCGPEELPQITGTFASGEDLSGRVTVIGYFSDRMVVLTQVDLRGDWGIAFVTIAALLTRD